MSEVPDIHAVAEEMYDISDEMAALAFDFNLISPETTGICRDNAQDLATCQSLFNTMSKLQKLMAEESETVETESWNYDTSVELLNVTLNLKKIPFGGGPQDLYSMASTIDNEGKERTRKRRPQKRTIYNMHPETAKDAWLGVFPGQSSSFWESSILFFPSSQNAAESWFHNDRRRIPVAANAGLVRTRRRPFLPVP